MASRAAITTDEKRPSLGPSLAIKPLAYGFGGALLQFGIRFLPGLLPLTFASPRPSTKPAA